MANTSAFAAIMLALSFMAISNAMYLSVAGPVSALLQPGQSVYLGKVAPGESFYVLASATTTNATGFVVNIGWDTMQAVNLPSGWSSQQSPLYENPMKIKITIPVNASYGIYNLSLQAVNTQNYSRLGNITITAIVNVTPYVYNVSVTPTNIHSGVGQPTNLYITLNNTGISDDPFNINVYGLAAWNLSDQVVALHGTRNSYVYPVFVNEPGSYDFNLTISSSTSQALRSVFPITLVAQASLLNDYSAVGQGVILSPMIFNASYEFMLFLSYIYNQVAK